MSDFDRDRLRALLDNSGLSARAAAMRAGLGETAVKDILSGKSRDPGARTINALAAVFGVEVDEFLKKQLQPHPPLRANPIRGRVPVVGEVAAGVWLDVSPLEMTEVEEFLEVDVPGYERARLRAVKVAGTSMSAVYPPGRYVIFADPAEAGVRVGDHVIVERNRAGLTETTLKEVEMRDGVVWLVPRSMDPAHQQAFKLSGQDDEQDAPRIVGVVVADYGKRDRPSAVFLAGF